MEGRKRAKNVLEMWQNLAKQHQPQGRRTPGNVRGRGRKRKAQQEKEGEIDTPGEKSDKEQE